MFVFQILDDRPEVPNILILLAGAIYLNMVPNVMLQADLVKREGIKIIGVGLVRSVSDIILKNLTATPEKPEGFFTLGTTFSRLWTLYPVIIESICAKHKPVIVHIGKLVLK